MAYLTKSEWGQLCSVIRGVRDKAIFTTTYAYGLRVSELIDLRLPDINFQEKRIFIRRKKGSTSGEWPLLPEVEGAINKWLPERASQLGDREEDHVFVSNRKGPFSRQTLHLMIRKYGEEAGLPKAKCHFHVLRHSCAMHLLEESHDVVGVQSWLGHRSIANTMEYIHILGQHRWQFAERLKNRAVFLSPTQMD
jgi:site-specific recombinase XerD